MRRTHIAGAYLALAGAAFAGSGSSTIDEVYQSRYRWKYEPVEITAFKHIVIMDEQNRLLVSIGRDGKITYGAGYTPDAAARLFWEAIGLRAVNCEKKP